jgi:hypothetical protein
MGSAAILHTGPECRGNNHVTFGPLVRPKQHALHRDLKELRPAVLTLNLGTP